MPFIGVGLHFLIALFFAVHAVRTRRELYWLILLFSFPLLGSLVYFLAIYLPQSRLDRGIAQAGKVVLNKLDPQRGVREAQQAFDLTPTAHNQTRLAGAMLEAGMFAEAVAQYRSCLTGPFAANPDIRLAAARALLANGQGQKAEAMLQALRQSHRQFRPELVGLVLAQSLAQAGKHPEAGAAFADLVEHFPSLESRTEYTIWALAQKQQLVADVQLKELNHSRKHMNKYARSLNADLFKRLDAAVQAQAR